MRIYCKHFWGYLHWKWYTIRFDFGQQQDADKSCGSLYFAVRHAFRFSFFHMRAANYKHANFSTNKRCCFSGKKVLRTKNALQTWSSSPNDARCRCITWRGTNLFLFIKRQLFRGEWLCHVLIQTEYMQEYLTYTFKLHWYAQAIYIFLSTTYTVVLKQEMVHERWPQYQIDFFLVAGSVWLFW